MLNNQIYCDFKLAVRLGDYTIEQVRDITKQDAASLSNVSPKDIGDAFFSNMKGLLIHEMEVAAGVAELAEVANYFNQNPAYDKAEFDIGRTDGKQWVKVWLEGKPVYDLGIDGG